MLFVFYIRAHTHTHTHRERERERTALPFSHMTPTLVGSSSSSRRLASTLCNASFVTNNNSAGRPWQGPGANCNRIQSRRRRRSRRCNGLCVRRNCKHSTTDCSTALRGEKWARRLCYRHRASRRAGGKEREIEEKHADRLFSRPANNRQKTTRRKKKSRPSE